MLSDDTHPENKGITLPEVDEEMMSAADDDTDSITCTVEESDLHCPQEEMLDLTITGIYRGMYQVRAD